jgi:DNA processing protein
VTPDIAYVTLALVPGIGRARLDALLRAFGSARRALQASQRDLEAVPGISVAAATAVGAASFDTARRVVASNSRLGAVVLTPGDPRFPAMLSEIPAAPTLLFALGDLSLLKHPAVAIVGSRTHTRYGAEACRLFAAGAARAGLVVVSGMARGLDAVAHTACLDAEGRTVGVLGNGLGVVYPSANRELYDRMAREGCLITEFPPGDKPSAGSFPRRNRLISGLARATLVVEAGKRSGALITVDSALEQGREVLAVPGPITSPASSGCNRLVQTGAKPALGLQDLLEEYGLSGDDLVSSVPAGLMPLERRVLDVLDLGVELVDEIAERLQCSAAETLAALTGLEIRGLVAQDPGKTFRRASVLGVG